MVILVVKVVTIVIIIATVAIKYSFFNLSAAFSLFILREFRLNSLAEECGDRFSHAKKKKRKGKKIEKQLSIGTFLKHT